MVADTEDSQARVHRLKRKDAQRAVATMEETVAAMRAGEEAKQGLLILSARWGDLSVSEEDASRAVSAPYIDVTVPLQYLVSDSTLIFPAGQSHSWLEGFYDPSLGTNSGANKLHVRYRFLNTMHQATFDDMEEVCIPMEEHVMPDSETEEDASTADAALSPSAAAASSSSSARSFASFSKRASTAAFASRSAASSGSAAAAAASVGKVASLNTTSRATLLAQAKARRRMVVYATLLAAGLGLYAVRSRGITMQSARLSAEQFAQWIKQLLGLGLGANNQQQLTATPSAASVAPPTYISSAPAAVAPTTAAAPVAAAAL